MATFVLHEVESGGTPVSALPNTYQAPVCQWRHVSRAPGRIGSRERWSKSSAVSRSPDFVSVALAQSSLCTQHLSRLSRRSDRSASASFGRRCDQAYPARVLETRSFPHAVPLNREVQADAHRARAARSYRARGRGRDPGEPNEALANGLERERVSNQADALPGVRAHDAPGVLALFGGTDPAISVRHLVRAPPCVARVRRRAHPLSSVHIFRKRAWSKARLFLSMK